MSDLAPVAPRERVATLDVLRGFAMLGVLVSNLFMLYSFRFASRGPAPDGDLLDTAATWFLWIAVQSKAQTLLTFLFGLGFAAQLLRARARDERIGPIYLRRLLALLAIGWFHVLFLSFVDVAWGYAIAGFFLLPFLRCSNRTRLVFALALTIIPTVIYAIPTVWPALHHLLFDHPPPKYFADFVAAARSGARLAILEAHVVLALFWTLGGGVAWYMPWLLGRFLLGYVAGAQRWFERDGADHLALFRKLLRFGALAAALGIALQVLQLTKTFHPHDHGFPVAALAAVIAAGGLLGQTAMYVAIVVLLMQRPAWRKLLLVLAPVGRMPLTTYLMQSLICTSLFYGWGLGWDTPAPAACIGLALAIFTAQIAISHLWLRWFRFGPAEWVWRAAVYLRAQPMRNGPGPGLG